MKNVENKRNVFSSYFAPGGLVVQRWMDQWSSGLENHGDWLTAITPVHGGSVNIILQSHYWHNEAKYVLIIIIIIIIIIITYFASLCQ